MFFWFFSGLVIVYSKPTTQSRSQQLAHADTLAPELGWLSLGDAWSVSEKQRNTADKGHAKADEGKIASDRTGTEQVKNKATNDIVDARLVRNAGEPLWLVEDGLGKRFAVSAIDGTLHKTSEEQALKIAENWLKTEQPRAAIHAQFLETVEKPIILRNQDALRPFHRVSVDDGYELLISARTGEVLHASSRLDRAFFWVGNWLHLFKPLEAIGLGKIRNDVQLWLGLSATLAIFTGLIIGWIRWRPGMGGRPTYSKGRTQPYRESWMKWHFWSGLIGGIFMFTWALSGFIDANPGKIFSEANPSKQEMARYFGKTFPEAMRNWQPVLPVYLATAVDGSDIVELGWRRLGDDVVLLAYSRDGKRIPQVVGNAEAAPRFSNESLLAAVGRLASKSAVQSQTLLTDYDDYYYPRHNQSLVDKPLPVLLVHLDDDVGTQFYLDPQDGRLLAKLDRSRRIMRWLYSGLHHWDFKWLNHWPLWDVWMLTWISFGLVLGTSSLVVGWRLLNKTFFPRRREATQPRASSRYLSEIKQS
jgi:hypothetical protein